MLAWKVFCAADRQKSEMLKSKINRRIRRETRQKVRGVSSELVLCLCVARRVNRNEYMINARAFIHALARRLRQKTEPLWRVGRNGSYVGD